MSPLETPEAMAWRMGREARDGGRGGVLGAEFIREDRRVIAEAMEQRAAEHQINGYLPEAGALRAFARALRGER